MSSLYKKEPVIILIDHGNLHYMVIWGFQVDEDTAKLYFYILNTNSDRYKKSEDCLKDDMKISKLYSSAISSRFTRFYPYNIICLEKKKSS